MKMLKIFCTLFCCSFLTSAYAQYFKPTIDCTWLGECKSPKKKQTTKYRFVL